MFILIGIIHLVRRQNFPGMLVWYVSFSEDFACARIKKDDPITLILYMSANEIMLLQAI